MVREVEDSVGLDDDVHDVEGIVLRRDPGEAVAIL
jgi:hypothetical protein